MAQRMTYLFISLIISLGIYLTGINTVHWLLFIPPGFLFFAAITGICPGLQLWKACGLK